MKSRHQEIIKLIYYFGNGLMLSIQIARYMERLGITKEATYTHIRELQNDGYLDVFLVNKHNCTKLKKPALSFVTGKHYSEMKSIEKSKSAILKTVVINEVILCKDRNYNSVDSLYSSLMKKSTYLYKQSEGLQFLEQFKEHKIQDEIHYLKKNRESKKVNNESLNCYGNHVVREFSFESLARNNVYVTKVTTDEIFVAIIDIRNNLLTTQRKSKLAELIIDIYNYLYYIFDRKINIIIIGVDSATKQKYFEIAGYVEGRLASNQLFGSVNIYIKSIDIVNKYFDNVKLI